MTWNVEKRKKKFPQKNHMVVITAIFRDLELFLDFGHDFLLYRASYRTKISL